MSILDTIPHHEGVMSVYTLCGFTLIIVIWIAYTTYYSRSISNEFRRIENWTRDKFGDIEDKCSGHDDYIDTTNGVINQIHIDLAVQESSMKDLKADIAEIKADIKLLLNRSEI